jgi:hypothetical protein
MNDDNSVLLQLRQEVRILRLMVVIVVGIVLVVLMVANLISSLRLPQAGRAFDEVIGDRNKLPELTKLVLSYGDVADGMLPIAVVVVLPVAACTVYLMFRKRLWAMFLVGSALLFLMTHWLLITLAIKMPMVPLVGPLQPLP